MQAVLKLMSKGREVDADIIEVDEVGRLLFIVLGRWQGSDLTKSFVKVKPQNPAKGDKLVHVVHVSRTPNVK